MRRLLCAVGVALALSVSGVGVAYAADETGPGTKACTDAGVAVTAAEKVRTEAQSALTAAQAELDKVENDPTKTNEEVQQAREARDKAKAALDNAELVLKARKDEQAKACGTQPSTSPRPTPSTRPTPPPHHNNHAIRLNCAEYARYGEFNFRRGVDPRYRQVLDQDGDGYACERNGDDRLRFGQPRLDGRDCSTLRADFDRAEEAVEDARRALNRVNREARSERSPEGKALSREERRDIRVAARVVDDRVRDRDAINERRKEVCKDNGGDVTVHVHVDPIEPEVLKSDDKSSGSSSSGGQVSVVPSGGIETGHVA